MYTEIQILNVAYMSLMDFRLLILTVGQYRMHCALDVSPRPQWRNYHPRGPRNAGGPWQ